MVPEIYETEHISGITIGSFEEYMDNFNRPTTDVQITLKSGMRYGFTSVKYFMDRSYLSVHWFPLPFTISTTVMTSYHAWQLASAFPLPLFCHPIRIERPVLAAWAAATWHYFWRILRGQTSLKKFSRKFNHLLPFRLLLRCIILNGLIVVDFYR